MSLAIVLDRTGHRISLLRIQVCAARASAEHAERA
jgi:hypothetical protein